MKSDKGPAEAQKAPCVRCHKLTSADNHMARPDGSIVGCKRCIAHCDGHGGLVDIQRPYNSPPTEVMVGGVAKMLCGSCRWKCADCDTVFSNQVRHRAHGSDSVCASCAEEYEVCQQCSGLIDSGDEAYSEEDEDETVTLCQRCCSEVNARARRNQTPLPDSIPIASYSFKPKPVWGLGAGEEKGRSTRFFGCEIEVECPRRFQVSEMHAHARKMNNLGPYYCKGDGSIGYGFEIVSHPGTIQWWRETDLSWTDELRKLGYRSFNTTTCGMHIHVSKSAITGGALERLHRFFRDHYSLVLKLSRRPKNELDSWAAVYSGDDKLIKAKVEGGRDVYHRGAINTMPTSTVEFRIYKGTLNKEAIIRNLELTNALIEYATHSKEMTPDGFVDWLKADGRVIVYGKDSAASGKTGPAITDSSGKIMYTHPADKIAEWVKPTSPDKARDIETSLSTEAL